jgi:perosamine synthetase
MEVPFFRPRITEDEITEVADTLRSGWLTTGPKTKAFEAAFAGAVGATHAIALNSCTAALHLALEALGLKPGEAVLVPSMTFAATAEVVRYMGAEPILVDCHPDTLQMDMDDAGARLARADKPVRGIMPVHVAGLMVDMPALRAFARTHGLWIVEDAAHSFPAAWRMGPDAPWVPCGSGGSEAVCFSFYANKTITTGEGGMAVTAREDLAERMRIMALHGISKDAWKRYTASGHWYYEIVAPGFKYNLTDLAASIGIHQLGRAEAMRREREAIADRYFGAWNDCPAFDLPPVHADRIHSWHLFYIRLRLDRLREGRDAFIEALRGRGVGCSVHWMPLHLHPYYRDTFGYRPEDLPRASAVWKTLVSLPLFPGMREEEIVHVIEAVRTTAKEFAL